MVRLSPERSAGINHERMAGALGLFSHRKLTGYVSQPKSLRAIFPFCELSGLAKMVQEVGPTLEWDNSMSRPFLGQGQKISPLPWPHVMAAVKVKGWTEP